MAAAVKFEIFSENLAKKVHDLHADALFCYLSNDAPIVATDAVKADVTEIAGGNGYTALGTDIANTVSRTGGTSTVNATDVSWTASGGTIGPFQYAVIYNDTPTSPADPLIQYWNYGTALTLQIGESFTVDFVGNAIMTIA